MALIGSARTRAIPFAFGLSVLNASCGGEGSIEEPDVPLPDETVSTVSVTPTAATIGVGARVELMAVALDSSGVALDRVFEWFSSDTGVVIVNEPGVITGVTAGGPVFLNATSEGMVDTAQVTVLNPVTTGITNIAEFFDRCPTTDSAFSQIRGAFELLEDGQLITEVPACTEPFSEIPVDQLTDELIAWQSLRVAYHMSEGTEGKLPWTDLSLFSWLSAEIDGVNLKSEPGRAYCCDRIDDKVYISVPRQDAIQRDFKRQWFYLSTTLALYAHERRHADAGALGHTTGCESTACDWTYDLDNLGAYGVQYWLQSSWATGYLNIGIGCLPQQDAYDYASAHADFGANGFRERFVTNTPPIIHVAEPYGGECPILMPQGRLPPLTTPAPPPQSRSQ